MPQISVIVPIYKVEPYLHRCVDSILRQTFTDFELILVDDGSPDNCGAICDEYAIKDSRVHVIHQKNGGLSAARNAGIDWAFAHSDSRWLAFIDSDDWVHPECLERLLEAAVCFGSAISICGYVETNGEEIQIVEADLVPEIWNAEDFYVEHNVNATIACGKLYRKKCFENIRYPVGRLHEDEFTTYRILFPCVEIVFIPAPLYAYYVNDLGITRSDWNPMRLNSVEAICEQVEYMKQHEFARGYKRAIKKYVFNLADHITKLQKNDVSMKHKYMQPLKKKLKRALFVYRDVFPFKENIWLFDLAFPRVMQLYWVGKTLINRATRIR